MNVGYKIELLKEKTSRKKIEVSKDYNFEKKYETLTQTIKKQFGKNNGV